MALKAPNLAEYFVRGLDSDEHKVLGFPSKPDARNGFKTWTPNELGVLADRAAAHYIQHGLTVRKRGERALIVGIWGTGTIEWVATFFAVVMMGHSALIISSRLPYETAEALLTKANGDILVYGDMKTPLSRSTYKLIPFVPIKKLESDRPSTNSTRCDTSVIQEDDIAFIAHSSGSTGLPKLFIDRHRDFLASLNRVVWWNDGELRIWCSSAIYNVVGVRLLILSILKTAVLVFDNDRVELTPEGMVGVLKEVHPEVAWLTTYTLEMVASHPDGTSELAKCNKISHFGAVPPKALGDDLFRHGVNIYTAYGTSEAAVLLTSALRPRDDPDWDYMQARDDIKPHMLFRPIPQRDDDMEQLYTLICLDTFPGINEEYRKETDPPRSYHTGDLFLKHPTKADRWKIVGRHDDEIKIYWQDRQALVSGLEYENRIKRGNEDVVDEVVLFGQSRSALGVLIFSQHCTPNSTTTSTLHSSASTHPIDISHLKARIWLSIQSEINSQLTIPIEQHMIVVVTGVPSQSLPRTSKLNIIRPQIYMLYKDLIDGAYEGGNGSGKQVSVENGNRLDLKIHGNGDLNGHVTGHAK